MILGLPGAVWGDVGPVRVRREPKPVKTGSHRPQAREGPNLLKPFPTPTGYRPRLFAYFCSYGPQVYSMSHLRVNMKREQMLEVLRPDDEIVHGARA